MRRFCTLILTFASLLLVSCNEEIGVSRTSTVRFEVGFAMTKAASSDEEAIGSVDLLVFRRDGGSLEAAARASGRYVEAEVPSGVALDYYVVANAPESAFSAVASESAFLSSSSSLADNDVGKLVMVGSGSKAFDGDSQETVYLDRVASKVTLEGITPVFLGSSFASSDVVLESVYLINVNGTCPYGLVPTAGETWYCRMGYDASLAAPLSTMLYASVGKSITSDETLTDTYRLYCYPNPTNNAVNSATAPEWSVRDTRLVVVLTIDGVRNYYHVDIPDMHCNYNYVIRDLRLLGPGSDHPDIPVVRDGLSFTVEVNPWSEESGEIIF